MEVAMQIRTLYTNESHGDFHLYISLSVLSLLNNIAAGFNYIYHIVA